MLTIRWKAPLCSTLEGVQPESSTAMRGIPLGVEATHKSGTGIPEGCQPNPCCCAKQLEGKAEPEFAAQRARNGGAGRVDEASRMPERRRAGDTVAVVIAIVGAIGEVKGLGDELKIDVFADFEVLGQAQIELEERIAAKRIIFGDGCDSR